MFETWPDPDPEDTGNPATTAAAATAAAAEFELGEVLWGEYILMSVLMKGVGVREPLLLLLPGSLLLTQEEEAGWCFMSMTRAASAACAAWEARLRRPPSLRLPKRSV